MAQIAFLLGDHEDFDDVLSTVNVCLPPMAYGNAGAEEGTDGEGDGGDAGADAGGEGGDAGAGGVTDDDDGAEEASWGP
ncbi:unnamed protein product [Vitrella brassicaformis CCMP3155]|uniref:Uncharacterized protein n=1 Tax=Vitrella brassicaformis (strain CCMP3155) TaxID=1169540 RepID=A0A0G4F428_VITBC|nr:unnamed protein product [Vitrella brassicaformis CCMP3155]|eukprot:CEM06471.1 unnamed protein product [Vitrella brassicaformis CCMP3155]